MKIKKPCLPAGRFKSQNLKSKIVNSPQGFTIIEMLVTIAIIATVATMSTQIILSLIRSNNKTVISNEVRQNGDFVMSLLERDIRAALNITSPNPAPSPGADGQTLIIQQSTGTTVRYDCVVGVPGTSNGSIKRNTTNDLLNTDVKTGVAVSSCNFNTINSNPTMVNIDFTLTQAAQAPQRSDLTSSQDFHNSITLRTY